MTLTFHLDDDAQRNIDYERECTEVAAERELHDAEYAPAPLSLRKCPKCGHPGGLVRCPRCHGSSAASVLTTALGGVGVVVSRGADFQDPTTGGDPTTTVEARGTTDQPPREPCNRAGHMSRQGGRSPVDRPAPTRSEASPRYARSTPGPGTAGPGRCCLCGRTRDCRCGWEGV